MRNTLCDHGDRCQLWRDLEDAIKHTKRLEKLFTDGAPLQQDWIDATETEAAARSVWLDHVLGYTADYAKAA